MLSQSAAFTLAGSATGKIKNVTEFEQNLQQENNLTSQIDHQDGGLPLISDSVFSLIIMLYVFFAFIFVFFLFCWRRGPDTSYDLSKVKFHDIYRMSIKSNLGYSESEQKPCRE